MSDRPILFSGPMIRALLDGSKTQTRRVLKQQDYFRSADGGPEVWTGFLGWQPIEAVLADRALCANGILPQYKAGDRLWVREAWRAPAMHDAYAPRDLARGMARAYEADDEQMIGVGDDAVPYPIGNAGKLRPGMFMPRWASRLTLDVTDVRVELLNEISEGDAADEGVGITAAAEAQGITCRDLFKHLWNSINGPDAWAANPWVAAISFRVHRQNIDAPSPSSDSAEG